MDVGYKEWGNMAIGQERMGEYPAEKGKLRTVCMQCQNYFQIWSTESRKMGKELREDEPGPAAGRLEEKQRNLMVGYLSNSAKSLETIKQPLISS